tara:strand:+ start:85 stop:468 length:384 start_codon:yes stop_codon:yes gene_type:complete
MEVQVPLFVSVARWTRTALAEKMRAASNAHLISHLPVRAMAKTAQELQRQVLPRRVKLAHFAVQEAELEIVVVVPVAHALPVITVMVGKMRVALNAHLINRLPVRMDCPGHVWSIRVRVLLIIAGRR